MSEAVEDRVAAVAFHVFDQREWAYRSFRPGDVVPSYLTVPDGPRDEVCVSEHCLEPVAG